MADYESCDPTHLDDWLKEVGGVEFRQYTYAMLRSGVDRRVVRCLGDEHLLRDCGIVNGVHRLRILDAAKRQCPSVASQHWLDAANCYICRKFREFVACLQNAPKNPSLLYKTLGSIALLFWSRNILLKYSLKQF